MTNICIILDSKNQICYILKFLELRCSNQHSYFFTSACLE